MILYSILMDFSPIFYWLDGTIIDISTLVPSIILVTMYYVFARLGTDYEIRNQWFFAILETMTTD